jgi:VIT1/CCC1 family predicted Fe2+/Mn2+ transporter
MTVDEIRLRQNLQAEVDMAFLQSTNGGAALGPSRNARTLAWLARRFGAGLVAPTVASREVAGRRTYDTQPDAAKAMRREEREHAQLLRRVGTAGEGGVAGATLARLEGRHRAVGGNALRAAVLGANDGLVSNLSLVMGVAGASLPSRTILITGIAGLLAGACSMAMGEWISVTSSRELYARQIALERTELELAPEAEREELALIYEAKGATRAEAEALADRLFEDPERALDTLVREELGIDPAELGGSAWTAAISSFIPFVFGALAPVLPFVFLSGNAAVGASLAASALGLFAIGSAITLVTGKSALRSGVRQLLIGLGAAALTYGIGAAIGVSVAA